MSVLDDIQTENGLWIREISSNISARDARDWMTMLKDLPFPRLDGGGHSEKTIDVPKVALDYCSAHYNDGERTCWGLPEGNFEDYLDRLMSNAEWWNASGWNPTTERNQSEQDARDLTLAGYLFPFRSIHEKSCLSTKLVVLPFIKQAKNVSVGSTAVSRLISAVAHKDSLGDALISMCSVDSDTRDNFFGSFNRWSAFFETGSSTNPHDAVAMADRVSGYDAEKAKEGWNYASLADFSNSASSAINMSRPRGRIGRNITSHANDVLAAEDKVETHKKKLRHKLKSAKRALGDVEYSVISDVKRKGPSRRKSVAFRTSRSPTIRFVSDGKIVVAHHTSSNETFILTKEDLKSLKFVSMSHSLWHLYAASLDIEYGQVGKVTPDSQVTEATTALLGQVASVFSSTYKNLMGTDIDTDSYQDVVPLGVCKAAMADLWSWYIASMDYFRSENLQDYFGRYLSENFAVYTSKMAGSLGKAEHRIQREDLFADWNKLGVPVSYHYSQFEIIMDKLPMSAKQDFGRLAKIVYPYDINAAYSFFDRANKMKKQNPILHTSWEGNKPAGTRPFTDQENVYRKSKYQSGLTVMLTASDLKSNMMAAFTPEQVLASEGLDWNGMLSFALVNNVEFYSKALLLDKPRYPVPPAHAASAKANARKFLRTAVLPGDPWAGAHIDIENLFSYQEQDGPNIGLVKATSIPASELEKALSNVYTKKHPIMTPTRDTLGGRDPTRGDMVADYLANEFPTRAEAIAYVRNNQCTLTSSVKIESSKYVLKNRIITSGAGPNRRIQSERDFNAGRACKNMPGYCMGVDPASIKRKQYATVKDDLPPGRVRVNGSLDLSSFSTGMDEEIQLWTDEVLSLALDGGGDVSEILHKCTKDTHMVFSQKNVHLYSKNTRGADYEGLDGKRNTAMHCALWYLARCEALELGVKGKMHAMIFIDDGSFSIECAQHESENVKATMKRALLTIYTAYGFDLSIFKTVFSEVYMQFLNEIMFHGSHIGYGFRALCHTGAQSFPELATVREELAVISSGIRGATVSGGHLVRLIYGYHALLSLYTRGVIGNMGNAIMSKYPLVLAATINLPTAAGGFGSPNITMLAGNTAGHRDVEKLESCRQIARSLRSAVNPRIAAAISTYMATNLRETARIKTSRVADRVTIAHSSTSRISPRSRSTLIATGALAVAINPEAATLLKAYLRLDSGPATDSFPAAFIDAARNADVPIPMVLAEKALGSDEVSAVVALVDKIASSRIAANYIDRRTMASLRRSYWRDGRLRLAAVNTALSIA